MSSLIIGHTTCESVTIWVHGEWPRTEAQVTLSTRSGITHTKSETLPSKTGRTATFQFPGLDRETEYFVTARFTAPVWYGGQWLWRTERAPDGRLRTFPREQSEEPFSFLLGSCNLSVVTARDLLNLSMGAFGLVATKQSLDRPRRWLFKYTPKWFRDFCWRNGFLVPFGFLFMATRLNSREPQLKSPFIKLNALMSGIWTLRFDSGKHEPPVGSMITCTNSGATGVVVFKPVVNDGSWKDGNKEGNAKGTIRLTQVNGQFKQGDRLTYRSLAFGKESSKTLGICVSSDRLPKPYSPGLLDLRKLRFHSGQNEPPVGSLIRGVPSGATGIMVYGPKVHEGSWGRNAEGVVKLKQVAGHFTTGDELVYESWSSGQKGRLGKCASDDRCPDPPERPAFMIHAGDQIYFDFPLASRVPTIKRYRSTYRDVWTEDKPLQHFLAQCPQYMTLDDHEIVENFANDFEPPRKSDHTEVAKAAEYLKHAGRAYWEFVHCRQVEDVAKDSSRKNGPFYYDFQYGDACFFVMDTRTKRMLNLNKPEPPEMICEDQLQRFEKWLTDESHKDKLKFVVSSVPFVAEVRPIKRKDDSEESHGAVDKWCGERFKKQRERIIEFIFTRNIRRLVFLCGDMHCCYHATMRIGKPDRRSGKLGRRGGEPDRRTDTEIGAERSVTVHELAAGPLYQLQLAQSDNFYPLLRRTTSNGNGVPFTCRLEQLHADNCAAMRISVENGKIRWDVIRTIAQSERAAAATMSGRIDLQEVR